MTTSAQTDKCDLNATPADFHQAIERIEAFAPIPSTPLPPAVIPVIVYVVMKDDGSLPAPFIGETVTDQEVDAILAQMSASFSSNANYTFVFERCGKVQIINNSTLQDGSVQAANYVYSPWAVNVIIDDTSGAPTAMFPWAPGPNNIIFWRGGYLLPSSVLTHEMGHSFGLFHTFGQSVAPPYNVPVPNDPNSQLDHPYNTDFTAWPRELVIRTSDPTKPFTKPNHYGPGFNGPDDPRGGDLLVDTPAGCNPNQQAAWPGCQFNTSNCTYTGSYVDYNGMPINDPDNILAKNFMSYGTCRTEFTPGQSARMFEYYLNQRQGQYKPQWCGNMDDAVEYKGTSKGLDRVSIEFTQDIGGISLFTTKAMTAPDGSFSGILQPSPGGSVFTVKAKVKKLGPNPDFSYNSSDWKDGVSTFDIVQINKHVLLVDRLDGYDQLAADVNNDNAVSTFDIVLIRKLILGTIDDFSEYHETPWRYVRESITLNNPQDFDDQEDDNPFQYDNLEGTSNYNMQANRQGFDFVKIGDVNGSNSEADFQNDPEEHGGPIFVDIVKLPSPTGKSIYEFQVSDFEEIAAYQFDISFPASRLQYSNVFAKDLAGVNPEFFGTTRAAQGLLKTLWYDEANANALTLPDGSGIFRLEFNGSDPLGQTGVQLANGLSFRANDDVPNLMTNIAFTKDGTIRPLVQRTYDDNIVAALEVLPNPFTTSISIQTTTVAEGTIDLVVYNALGQPCHRQNQLLTKGQNTLRLENLGHLPNGLYYLHLKSGKHAITKKIVKAD